MPLIDAQEFRQIVARMDPMTVVEDVLLDGEAKYVSEEQATLVRNSLCARFGLKEDAIKVIVVGSAKLGYSLSEKLEAGVFLPRYRMFRQASDMDFAVVSSTLYLKVWRSLSNYSHASTPFPWKSNKLGDFNVVGWLRPDYFPIVDRPKECIDWWEVFGELTRNPLFRGHKVRVALYFHMSFLKDYQVRSVIDCQREEFV